MPTWALIAGAVVLGGAIGVAAVLALRSGNEQHSSNVHVAAAPAGSPTTTEAQPVVASTTLARSGASARSGSGAGAPGTTMTKSANTTTTTTPAAGTPDRRAGGTVLRAPSVWPSCPSGYHALVVYMGLECLSDQPEPGTNFLTSTDERICPAGYHVEGIGNGQKCYLS